MDMRFRGDEEKIKCSVGALFKRMNVLYVLAQVGHNEVALITLDEFPNRFDDPVIVKSPTFISEHEWALLTGNVKMELVGHLKDSVITYGDIK